LENWIQKNVGKRIRKYGNQPPPRCSNSIFVPIKIMETAQASMETPTARMNNSHNPIFVLLPLFSYLFYISGANSRRISCHNRVKNLPLQSASVICWQISRVFRKSSFTSMSAWLSISSAPHSKCRYRLPKFMLVVGLSEMF